jgi:hypothetical protein
VNDFKPPSSSCESSVTTRSGRGAAALCGPANHRSWPLVVAY